MTNECFCGILSITEKEKRIRRDGSGKGKKMFTAIHSSYLYPESLKNAALGRKEERGFRFVYSDKKVLGRNTVMKDVGLS